LILSLAEDPDLACLHAVFNMMMAGTVRMTELFDLMASQTQMGACLQVEWLWRGCTTMPRTAA
jgi:hypothetical protein